MMRILVEAAEVLPREHCSTLVHHTILFAEGCDECSAPPLHQLVERLTRDDGPGEQYGVSATHAGWGDAELCT